MPQQQAIGPSYAAFVEIKFQELFSFGFSWNKYSVSHIGRFNPTPTPKKITWYPTNTMDIALSL
jgi:hypothetical protein